MDILVPYQGISVLMDASMFTSIQTCARYFDLRFNRQFQKNTGKSVNLEMGSIVHEFLKTYYKSIINGIPKKNAVGFGMAAAIAYFNSSEVTNSSDADKKLALDTCEQYIDYWKNDSWVPLEVEVVKKKQLYQDDEVRIIWAAKMDYIGDSNSGIFNWDHKSMKQNRTTLNLNNQFTGQCFIMGTRIMYVNKVGFQKTLPPDEKFIRVPLNYTTDRILEWQTEIVPYWIKTWLNYKESEYYPPNFTHCDSKFGWCMFKDVCEANPNMREEVLMNDYVVGEPWEIEDE